MIKRIGIVFFGLVFALAGCSGGEGGPKNHHRGVYMLIDTSGTYTKELEKAQNIIKFLLARLNPGDSFAVARIDTGSFSEKDIVAKVTLDDRPSMANQQKRVFSDEVDEFVKTVKPASYTDITGGVLQAVEFLNEKNPGKKTILIFSDLKEDLDKGYIRDIEFKLKGFEVIALNVTKLSSDNYNPNQYLARLEQWQTRVESGGGRWHVTNDMDQLEHIFIN
ncbi:vWA domain-containing protein [Kaarinaea lacus]